MTPFLRGRAEEGTKGPSREMDNVLLGVVACILAIGVVMVYSASSALAGKSFGDELHYFKGQALRAVVGFILMLWIASSDLAWLSRHARAILLGAFLLLLLVLVPGIGIKIRGARRWLKFTNAEHSLHRQSPSWARPLAPCHRKRFDTCQDAQAAFPPAERPGIAGKICAICWKKPSMACLLRGTSN